MAQFRLFNFLVAILLSATVASAQLTLKITSIPANTPPGATLYAVGTFNNWNPGDATKTLTALGNGQYQIVLTPAVGQVKFKFTRGAWATVEGNASGGFLPDRVLNYNGQPTTVNLTILSWEDLGGGGNGSGTAAANVQILDDDFYMPELNRNRRIWLYLPPDYQSSNKNYPVLYMHDGQNLFDATTAAFGEWEVDESLNELHTQGDYGCIVVGIDNSQYRLDEYSPWVNAQYNAGGQGDEYVAFIVNTLKPYIDAHYRTLPGRSTTGIAGSSMGGLISMYALSEHQDVFSKAGIFSPAFWFGGDEPVQHVLAHPKEGPVRVSFLSGADEEQDGNQSNYVVNDMADVANAMNTAGFTTGEIQFQTRSDGAHSEWFWAREFPAVYQWLFAGAVSGVKSTSASKLEIFPNPAGDWVRISGLDNDDEARFRIFDQAGKIVRDTTLVGDEPLYTGNLPKGVYVVKGRKKGGKWLVGRLVR